MYFTEALKVGWRVVLMLGWAGSLMGADANLRAEEGTASGLQPDVFLKQWLVLGPIPIAATPAPELAAQQQAFARDWLASAGTEQGVAPALAAKVEIDGKSMEWRGIHSSSDVIDLGHELAAKEHCVAYAAAEIEMAQTTKVLLGIGSDDGVKVWLNGKLIHENWTGRAAQPDDDLVAAEFQQGRNRLLFKIQNQQGSWGFVCRRAGKDTQAKKFLEAVSKGELENVTLLLRGGVDVNLRGPLGLTPYQSAKLHGRTEMMEYLAREGATTTLPIPSPETVVEALFQSAFKSNGPGAAVLVGQDGKILLQRAYGLADVGNRVAVTPETKFRIGSITKQFTAAAVLKLYEEGKLSLQDPLSKYIPEFPRGQEVTVHHLLTHTSGIHSYTSKTDFMASATVGIKPEELINSFKHDPYDFDPGQKWLYNNSGFFLLGYIIEKVSQKSYPDYLRDTFFKPLGMKNTGVHEASTVLDNEATGYSFENGNVRKALNWDMSKAGGAGALYSTVGDLHRWNEAVWGGSVLKDSSLKAAFTPVKTPNDETQGRPLGYGYGWGITSLRGALEIAHGGGLNGFLSFLLRLPDEKFTVAVLVNSAPPLPGGDPGTLAHEIAEVYLGEKLAPRESRKVDPGVTSKELEQIVGRYDYGEGILVVTLENGRLFGRLARQPKFEIFPMSATNFFWKVVEAEVSFVKDHEGRVTKAVHKQGGALINAPRLPDYQIANVDPKVYDEYVGRYDCGGGKSILRISREGDHLFAEMAGTPKVEIFPRSPTEFFCTLVNAEVAFLRDSTGKILHAAVKRGGSTTEAPRMK